MACQYYVMWYSYVPLDGGIRIPNVTCRAKVALQKLNTDVVHGVSSGNLDVDAIALDNRDVQSALGGAIAAGPRFSHPPIVPLHGGSVVLWAVHLVRVHNF